MLNRKAKSVANGANHQSNGSAAARDAKGRVRRRFIISPKAHLRPEENQNGQTKPAKPAAATPPVKGPKVKPANPATVQQTFVGAPGQTIDLTETIKTLLHLAHEHGHITYDDINDVLPEGLSPDDLDELYTKLRGLDIEIVDQAEVERNKPAEPEEEPDTRLEALDDPVRMYMNQMGKVPLLTREQEVEVCKQIEEADLEVKRLVCGLGFAAKEHVAVAEKLLAEPPRERFDRVVIDNKIAGREAHLKNLRRLNTKIQALDSQVDDPFARTRGHASASVHAKHVEAFKK